MNSTKLFFSLLRHKLLGEELKIEEYTQEELAAAFHLAEIQDYGHIIGEAAISNNLVDKNSELFTEMRRKLLISVYRSEQFTFYSESICKILEENKIRHIPLKGAVLRNAYPEKYMRTSCDFDVLVPKEDTKRAADLIEKQLNGKVRWVGVSDVSITFKSIAVVEIHFDLEKSGLDENSEVLRNIWNYVVPAQNSEYRYEMPDEYFYYYHISHMAKHMKNGGCGIKPFVDLWFLNRDTSNREARDKLLIKDGLKSFETISLSLANYWMGKGKSSAEIITYAKYILNSGVYGIVGNAVTNERIFRFDRVFLPPEQLAFQYRFLNKAPFLYPLFALVRIFRLLFITTPNVIYRKLIHSKKGSKARNEIEELFRQFKL